MYTLEQLQQKTFGELKKIGEELNVLPAGDRRLRETWVKAIAGVNPPLLQLLEVSAASVEQVQEPIIETVETSPGVEVDRVPEPIVQVAKTSPGVEAEQAQEPISQVAKTSPGVEFDQLPECAECFDDGFVEEESGLVRLYNCSSEPKLSRQSTQSTIAAAANISKSGQNPWTGIALSDRFLARYSPPQAQIFSFQSDAEGQLSLIDFEVLSPPEPPDPDDFESLEEFREALARWDAENAERLDVSMDSMCEWAPCPEEWYEPEAEILPLKASSMLEMLKPSKVMEHLRADDISDTSDFFIPTFGAWCAPPTNRLTQALLPIYPNQNPLTFPRQSPAA